MEEKLDQFLKAHFSCDILQATNEQLYQALVWYIREIVGKMEQNMSKKAEKQGKKLYYVSAEFLMGRLLSNNLLNLGLYEEVQSVLEKYGRSLAELEEQEAEPSLGNGGLGRLAACFLDSIATLGISGEGVGLLYHFGLFRQRFEQNSQKEYPDRWLTENAEFLHRTDLVFPVHLKDTTVHARMYELDVVGYAMPGEEAQTTKLKLFDLEEVDEGLVKNGIEFDKEDIRHNLTLFLYPDDSDEAGRMLRIYQQYFMVSAAAQMILKETKERGCPLEQLDQYVVIQINDTHPTMIIPELIRLLMEEGIGLDQAIRLVSRTCAYTNHTILAEALETWPLSFLEKAVPQLVPIIEHLDKRAKALSHDPKTAIIDSWEQVHMAHIDIHYGFSINGVAKLHTDILKSSELNAFYELYPERFHNETNGITFRRWLMLCNPQLSAYITSLIGEGWKKDAQELQKLMNFVEDETVLRELLSIKQQRKQILAEEISSRMGIEINPNSIYDIQIKRLHEYKRQQMNALYAIRKYFEIKSGKLPKRPITLLFGAKAAPAYTIAKDIIHLILCLQQLFAEDPQVAPYLKIVMVENYNVSWAEKLIPACDVSEQISLASKEASGTGNMKLMLNGAVTLGTMDGANVEIAQLVGKENCYIFGKSSDEVMKLYETKGYCSRKIYEQDPMMERLVDFIISKEMIKRGDPLPLCRLYKEIINKDWFMTLLDLKEYIQVKEQMFLDFEDRMAWSRKMLYNIAQAGYFSADRTIKGYCQDIWKL